MAPHLQYNAAWDAFFTNARISGRRLGPTDIINEVKRHLRQPQWAPWKREVNRLGTVSPFF